jgi:hypothetical protein
LKCFLFLSQQQMLNSHFPPSIIIIIIRPIRFGLDPNIYTLLSRWLYASVQDESLDKLTAEYFGALVPPPGSTSENADATTSAAAAAVAGVSTRLLMVASTMVLVAGFVF